MKMKKIKKTMIALVAGAMLLSTGGMVAEANTCVNAGGCRDVITRSGQGAMNSSGMDARRVLGTMARTGGSGTFTARIQRRNSAGTYVNDVSLSRTTNGANNFWSSNFSAQQRFRIRATGDTRVAGTARIVRDR